MVYKKFRQRKAEIEQDQLIAAWKRTIKDSRKKKIIVDPKIKKVNLWEKSLKRLKGRSYEKFLKSTYWAKVRQAVLSRDKNKCIVCGTQMNLQVHHTTYKNHLKEHLHLEDLQTLCKNHHVETHRKIKAGIALPEIQRTQSVVFSSNVH